MSEIYTADLMLDVNATIGEGPYWDSEKNRLLWVDLPAGGVYELNWDGVQWRDGRAWSTGGNACIAIPMKSGGLLVGSDSHLLKITENGEVTKLCSIDVNTDLVRFNEGKCDAKGRLWIGTAALDGSLDAKLYRFDPDNQLSVVLDGVGISNGLDWSPDRSKLYYTDSVTMGVDVFDFDIDKGSISNRHRLIDIERGVGVPDGITVDADGCIWLALFMGGQVRRYSQNGNLLATIEVDALQTTSCAFAGPDLDQLIITSASTPLPPWLLEMTGQPPEAEDRAINSPHSGALFSFRTTDIRGLLSNKFSG